jgi:hypothetical protein
MFWFSRRANGQSGNSVENVNMGSNRFFGLVDVGFRSRRTRFLHEMETSPEISLEASKGESLCSASSVSEVKKRDRSMNVSIARVVLRHCRSRAG